MSEKKPAMAELIRELERRMDIQEQALKQAVFTFGKVLELKSREVVTLPLDTTDRPEIPDKFNYYDGRRGMFPRPADAVNCVFRHGGNCMHHSGSRSWFGKTPCIERDRPSDPRIKPGCALKCEYPKPPAPKPPPKQP